MYMMDLSPLRLKVSSSSFSVYFYLSMGST